MRSTRRGSSLVHVLLSLGTVSIVVITIASIGMQLLAFPVGAGGADSANLEVRRAFLRTSELVRKSGWVTAGGATYPRVLDGGREIQFKAIRDLDQNGHGFSEATGELEWDAQVFSVRLDPPSGVLAVYSGGLLLLPLARQIGSVQFATYLEDPSLGLKEVQVRLVARADPREESIRSSYSGIIALRN